MEAIGAVATVLQVAQIGTQLSIALYHFASSISSATKEITYIAKDVALFSAVLKDLSRALDLGSKANLFREDAFETSIKIVDECKRVFTDIEAILKRVSKNDAPLHNRFEVSQLEKILWHFRKGKVDFLRGLLESLKSTILLELAVLNYATKVSSPLTKDTVDVDELLALQSLVLANETSTNNLRELAKTQDKGETCLGPVAVQGVAMQHSSGSPATELLTQDLAAFQSQHPTQINNHSTSPVFSESTQDTFSTVKSSAHSTRIDRYEFALQRLNLAKWEHERIEENVAIGSEKKPSLDDQRREEFLLGRLRADMKKFGLDQSLVERALKILQKSGPWDTSRMEIHYTAPKTESTMEILELAGTPWVKDQNDASNLIIRRWLPDMFGDVLWEHTRQFLKQKGLLEMGETCLPTGSETSALDSSPHGKQDKGETTDARTPIDHPQGGRKSTLCMLARSDTSSELDVVEIHSGRPNIGKVVEVTTSGDIAPQEFNPEEYTRSLGDIAEERDQATRNTHTAEWLDALPGSSAPIDQQRLERSSSLRWDSNDDRGAKSRRVNASIEYMDQKDLDHHNNLYEHLVDLGIDTLQSSAASRDDGYNNCHNQPASTSQRPQARNAPVHSHDAMMKFLRYSEDLEMLSRLATAGSEESEFDFATYMERRQEGIQGRERFFQQERDNVLKSVDHLLRKWTYIDVPSAGQTDKTAEPALLQREEPA